MTAVDTFVTGAGQRLVPSIAKNDGAEATRAGSSWPMGVA